VLAESRPTLDTVAKAAGVSRMTVSNAYNRPDQLSAATRERVLAVAEALGYSGPDPAGASLRRGRVGAVGVVLTEQLAYAFTDPGLVSFMRGVVRPCS
jgi:DNA-binding LacI/PurR family transcriptional regulator